jgi:hypothetical protein
MSGPLKLLFFFCYAIGQGTLAVNYSNCDGLRQGTLAIWPCLIPNSDNLVKVLFPKVILIVMDCVKVPLPFGLA